jgi:hypothetical protein
LTEFQLVRNTRLTGIVVYVDGITRAGKSLIGPILNSLDRVELERHEETFEYVGALYRLGKIERDAAVATLKLRADMFLYDGLLGRNMNLRFGDQTGIWRQTRRLSSLKRLWSSEGPDVLTRIAAERPIFQNQTHDQLANFDLHREAFGEELRFVEVVRHPIGLIDSWIRRGWGTRFQSDPLAMTYTLESSDDQVPYYAAGWEAEFLAASPEGRVVGMISRIWRDIQDAYRGLTEAEAAQVHFIIFDKFILDPVPWIEPLASFLGTTATRHTKSMLKRRNLPRRSTADFDAIRKNLLTSISSEESKLVEELESEYHDLLSSHPLVQA